MKQNAFEMERNILGMEEMFWELNTLHFWGMERFVRFGFVFSFPQYLYFSHSELAFCLPLLRQNDITSLFL